MAASYYRTITIDKDKVSANLTDFPVYVDLVLGNNVSSSSGYDVSFTLNDGETSLYHNLELWDNTNKRWKGWVKVSSLSSSADTVIRVYYGDDDISTDQSSTSTWSKFVAVWFLSEDSLDSSSIKDRTSNGADMSAVGSELTARQSGKLTYSVERSNDTSEVCRLVTDSNVNIPSGDYTVLAWIYKSENTPNNGQMIWQVDNGYMRCHSNTQTWRSYSWSNQLTQASTSPVSNTEWHRIACIHSGTNEKLTSFLNGSSVTEASIITNEKDYYGTNTSIALFSSNTAAQEFPGRISHVFIATSELGSDWISTDYNNQSSPSTFYSLGSEQEGGGTNLKINIGDTWKDVSEMKINIGDTWKDVSGAKINIGDTWKDIF
jgi:biopolymer transport protein ExbB